MSFQLYHVQDTCMSSLAHLLSSKYTCGLVSPWKDTRTAPFPFRTNACRFILPHAHSHVFRHLYRQSKNDSSHKSRRDTYFWNRFTPKSNNAPGTTCPFTTMCCTAQHDDDKRVSITCVSIRQCCHDLLVIRTGSSIFHARGRTIKRAECSAIFAPDTSSTPQAACRTLKWP